MCSLKSPVSQLLSNKSVKVFSAPKRGGCWAGGGGGGGGGLCPQINFCLAGAGGLRPPCSPLLRRL